MMNLYEYIDVMERKVIPDIWSSLPDDAGKFQQDYAPCLSSEKWRRFSGNKRNVLL